MSARRLRPPALVAHELAGALNYRASYRHRHCDDLLIRAMWADNDREIGQLWAELCAHPDLAGTPEVHARSHTAAPSAVARRLTVVNIPTRSRGWVVSWYPPLGSYTAAHFAGTGPQAACTRLYGAAPGALPTVAELERRLGFRLPVGAVAGLLADRLPDPPGHERSGAFPPGADETPDPTRAVTVNGRPATHPGTGLGRAAGPCPGSGAEEIGL